MDPRNAITEGAWEENVKDKLRLLVDGMSDIPPRGMDLLWSFGDVTQRIRLISARESESLPGSWWMNLRVGDGGTDFWIAFVCQALESVDKENPYLFMLPPDVVTQVLQKTGRTKDGNVYKFLVRRKGAKFYLMLPPSKGGASLELTRFMVTRCS
jgi:hypothetical protein